MELLNPTQKQARDALLKKFRDGVYTETTNSCVCGSTKSVVIATYDRYDLPIRTVLCERCGILRADPYYSEKTLIAFYDNEYRPLYLGHEIAEESFFKEQTRFGRDIYSFLKDHHYRGNISGKTVFDIGCGGGGVLNYFKHKGNTVFGCDYGEKYLRIGRERGLDLFHGASEVLRPHGPADIIILRHVLEHMLHPVAELENLRSLLKEDGVIYIEVPGVLNMRQSYGGDLMTFLQNAHVWYFTRSTLEYTAGRAGLKLESGNEDIKAIFTKSEKTDLISQTESARVASYLRSTERFKYFYISRMWVQWIFGQARNGAAKVVYATGIKRKKNPLD